MKSLASILRPILVKVPSISDKRAILSLIVPLKAFISLVILVIPLLVSVIITSFMAASFASIWRCKKAVYPLSPVSLIWLIVSSITPPLALINLTTSVAADAYASYQEAISLIKPSEAFILLSTFPTVSLITFKDVAKRANNPSFTSSASPIEPITVVALS